MRVRALRIVVAVVLVVVAGVPMLPGRAAGTASLRGQGVVYCPEWDPTCSFEAPWVTLSQLFYDAQDTAADTLTFEYVPGIYVPDCVPFGEGPGSCRSVGTGPDRFIFATANTVITATGMCRNVTTSAANCDAPGNQQLNSPGPANGIPSLPVIISTRTANDQISIVLPPVGQEFEFTINTGIGNDVVTLVDNTGHANGGADQIFCGPGTDRVTTNSDVFVADDCETVTRLT
jgi:hypothetical protein